MTSDIFTLDHVIPKSKGGINHDKNYRPACISCNAMKKDMTVEEFRAVLTETKGISVFHFEVMG